MFHQLGAARRTEFVADKRFVFHAGLKKERSK